MFIDKTTLQDLGIFNANQSNSIFLLINETITDKGREMLKTMIVQPPKNIDDLLAVQSVVKYFYHNPNFIPSLTTNGTLVMIEKFFEQYDPIAHHQSALSIKINGWFKKTFSKSSYENANFSITHVADFIKTCNAFIDTINDSIPELLKNELLSIKQLLKHPTMANLVKLSNKESYATYAKISYETRHQLKSSIKQLIIHYAKIDAWMSLAKATIKHRWSFPTMIPGKSITLKVHKFYHPLLQNAISYNVALEENKNLLILTGANMSGKTTFMRALGITTMLAHLGCGVPADHCEISFMNGVITNMHVEDNLLMGESYFYAEVKRMKNTAERMTQHSHQLVLMDELFKGTNVHDAEECTSAVINGLLNHHHHLFVLSTHLYEVAEQFKTSPRIKFSYFKTHVLENGQFHFNYQLVEGISQDRIGYKILQQEGIMQILNGETE